MSPAAAKIKRREAPVVAIDRPPGAVLEALAARGIAGGLDLAESYPELGNALLVCATETKNTQDIERYAAELGSIASAARAA